jgi:hypothetical protein
MVISKKKDYRHRYFLIEIKTGLEGPSLPKLVDSGNFILKLLQYLNFPSQDFLETTLEELVIQKENPRISFNNFIGWLEPKPEESLFVWKIFCQTSAPTTAVSVYRTLSEILFPTEESDKRKRLVKVKSQESMENWPQEFSILLPDSNWSPGYFHKQLSNSFDCINNSEINLNLFNEMLKKRVKMKNIMFQFMEKHEN